VGAIDPEDPRRRIQTMLADGYHVASVDSTPDMLAIQFQRGREERTLAFDEDDARRLLFEDRTEAIRPAP
jgi:ubiquinone/menaquinone biosynthesis C-methylase UbiE